MLFVSFGSALPTPELRSSGATALNGQYACVRAKPQVEQAACVPQDAPQTSMFAPQELRPLFATSWKNRSARSSHDLQNSRRRLTRRAPLSPCTAVSRFFFSACPGHSEAFTAVFVGVAPSYTNSVYNMLLTTRQKHCILYVMRLIHIILLVFVVFILSSCTIHFKAKDMEFQSKPLNPELKLSNHTYELEKVSVFRKES